MYKDRVGQTELISLELYFIFSNFLQQFLTAEDGSSNLQVSLLESNLVVSDGGKVIHVNQASVIYNLYA